MDGAEESKERSTGAAELAFIEATLAEISPFVASRYGEREGLAVSAKGHANDWLTEVDEETQRRLASKISARFPDDIVVGEELGMNRFPRDPDARCWLLDPIDGTQNFVRGLFPMYGVSMAFVEGGVVRAGGVAMPGLGPAGLSPEMGTTFLAQRGAGAWQNGVPVEVSGVASLELARVEVDLGNFPSRARALRMFPEIMAKAGQVRCVCAAVVGLCSVAADAGDAYFASGLSPWDYAAAALIVEEAGGRVTRLDGSDVALFDGRWGLLATNGVVHDECLRAIVADGG